MSTLRGVPQLALSPLPRTMSGSPEERKDEEGHDAGANLVTGFKRWARERPWAAEEVESAHRLRT